MLVITEVAYGVPGPAGRNGGGTMMMSVFCESH